MKTEKTETTKLNAAQKSWITRRAKAKALRERALLAWKTRRAMAAAKTKCVGACSRPCNKTVTKKVTIKNNK